MFTTQNLLINRGRTTSNANGGDLVTVMHTYKDLAGTVANIIMGFPDYLNQGATQDVIFVGDHMLIEGSDTTYFCPILSLAPFTVGSDLFSNSSSNLSVGAPTAATDGNAAKITGDVLQMQIADATHPGVLTNIAQDIGGEKTFHADVNISDPVNGLTIEKESGDFGQTFVTGDLNAVASINFTYSGDPYHNFEIKYSPEGLNEDNVPQLFLCPSPGTSMGVTLDNNGESGRVMLNSMELYASVIHPSIPNGNVWINGWSFTSTGTFIFPGSPYANLDMGNYVPNTITLNLDLGDYFGYNVSTNTFSWVIGDVEQFSLNSTSGLQTDIGLDRITAGTLNIGSNNATAISLLQDTTIATGKALIAPSGITLTPGATLSYYQFGSFPTTVWDNGAVSTANDSMSCTVIGSLVCLASRAPLVTAGQATPGAFFVNQTPLPVNLRPNLNKECFIKVLNGTTASIGYGILDTSGFIRLYANIDLTTTFTPAVTNTISFFEFTYTLSSP